MGGFSGREGGRDGRMDGWMDGRGDRETNGKQGKKGKKGKRGDKKEKKRKTPNKITRPFPLLQTDYLVLGWALALAELPTMRGKKNLK